MLIDLSDSFPNRQRSYSATDIRGTGIHTSGSGGRALCGGGMGSVSSLIDLPIPSQQQPQIKPPVYGNINMGEGL